MSKTEYRSGDVVLDPTLEPKSLLVVVQDKEGTLGAIQLSDSYARDSGVPCFSFDDFVKIEEHKPEVLFNISEAFFDIEQEILKLVAP